jgi:protocatechuate 3,4-dioxygenase beta subunit
MDTTRRDFGINVLGGLTAAALLGTCGSDDPVGPSGDAGATCTVYPRETEGPFYLDLDMLRSDVTAGKPGAPLAIDIQVVGGTTCAPLPDVAVDIWHCDAGGVYSGYPNQLGGVDTTGQTFLRGTQITDADGRVRFATIYPGWYPGRTTHIHFKVHVSSTAEATSQLYFPEEMTRAVYGTGVYVARGQKDTSNSSDSVARNDLPPLLSLGGTIDALTATLTIVVAS